MEHEPHDETQSLYDHLRQSNESARHQIARMISEMPQDHLHALAILLGGICSGGGKGLAAFYQGQAVAALESRFNICTACGKDHDEQLAHLTGTAKPTWQERDAKEREALEKEVAKFSEFLFKSEKEAIAEVPDLRVGESGDLSAGQQEKMREYNLDDLREEETGALLGFVCLKCGKQYQSIDDRALDPDGKEREMCEGCIHHTKWG